MTSWKLAAIAATAVLLLLLPAATAVLLLFLPAATAVLHFHKFLLQN